MVQWRAKSPLINRLVRECAMILAPMGRCMQAVHVHSAANKLADSLSRLAQGAVLPTELETVPRMKLLGCEQSDWLTLQPLKAGLLHDV
eukprot:6491380-Amphidinium_carterae.1